ncbi:MAG: hypothetical protein M3123_05105 [Actinomycetota bacterium]|nr:hypothetical protein [Actinomycetota bacterium]
MRLSAAALVAVVFALAVAAPLHAGTARVSYTHFQNGTIALVTAEYVAAPDEVNVATVTVEATQAGTVFRVHDASAPVIAGRGFIALSNREAVATVTEVPANGFVTRLSLGDRNDRALVDLPDAVPVGDAVLAGGPGSDELVVASRHSGAATLVGGPGSDLLDGGSGGGAASYVDHLRPVRVDLDGVDDDGSLGERDRLRNITIVWGGPRNDAIIGSGAGERLFGRGGSDVIHGGGGNDTLDGEWGADRVAGGLGHDRVEGGAGNDVLYARDGLRDLVYGRSGFDRALLDRIDAGRGIERRL